ncbi:PLP-dependent aminotransferase family protein [Pelosinus sp. sgz500959]|uniref:MocR-like pyridoxine biosynthesis transcription factor PdxR n=1 Tax=Pelosinus sp. sgz500959 TaxID=3242472 RepID=UPI003671A485
MNLITLESKKITPLYIQLYNYFKTEIEDNRLNQGEKLPSIRGLAKSLSISKITVEKAYQQLVSEGYIENYDRSRYTVNKLDRLICKTTSFPIEKKNDTKKIILKSNVRYDFSSGEMDIDGFDFSLWKRYISKAFLHKERLVSYGNIKGEEELRIEIAKYIQKSRGVYTHKSQIIIGAGVQNLLSILCSILKLENNSIAFEEPGFKNGRRIFADNAFKIKPIKMKKDGIDMEELVDSGETLVYVSPSHQFPTGYIMPIGRRNQLLNWAKAKNGTIIEDDYDSEFRYYGRPIPALKGLDTRGNVVYLGSFSKIIPPSIRISYMVLPEKFLEIYQKKSSLYNQAASTIEQLALAQFMADGHLERQIRKLRKLYYEKNRLFFDSIKTILGENVEVNENESGLHTILTVKSNLQARELVERALQHGCRVAPVEDYYWEVAPEKLPQIILYFSKIPGAEMKAAMEQLKVAWFI